MSLLRQAKYKTSFERKHLNYCYKFLLFLLAPKTKIPTIMNIIGQRIKKLREEKGITQEAMAHQLDVTQSNYGRLEKDDRRLNVVKLLKIVRILNVNISYLFNEVAGEIHDEDNPAFTNSNKEVYDILVDSLRAEIQHLKDEITFLRVMVRS